MALQQQDANSGFDRYIAEIRSIWGNGKDPELPFKIKALMEKLFAFTTRQDEWMAELIRDGKPSRELWRDPDHGFIQMGHVHKQGHGNPPHDHGPCWVVYGCYSGITEITKYKRTDERFTTRSSDTRERKTRSAGAGCGSALLARRNPLHSYVGRTGRCLSFSQLRSREGRTQPLYL